MESHKKLQVAIRRNLRVFIKTGNEPREVLELQLKKIQPEYIQGILKDLGKIKRKILAKIIDRGFQRGLKVTYKRMPLLKVVNSVPNHCS